MMVKLQRQDYGPVCFSFLQASASQKPESETNSLAVELALEKLESWLLRK